MKAAGARALLDQPEQGERVAIVLGREGRERERLRRPRHQLLDNTRLAEGGPDGEIGIVRLVVVALVAFLSALGSWKRTKFAQ